VSGQLQSPAALHPRERAAWYPLDRRLGGTQSCSGRGGEEKNSQPPPGIETCFINLTQPTTEAEIERKIFS